MERSRNEGLKNRIRQEMMVEYSGALEKNLDLAKEFIAVTPDGTVDVLVKDRVTGTEGILLYLIGRLYALEAGLVETSDVGNKELMDELGIPKGSLFPWLKELREQDRVLQVRRGRYAYHSIPLNMVERTLRAVAKKLKKAT